jgi:hypothetical protein
MAKQPESGVFERFFARKNAWPEQEVREMRREGHQTSRKVQSELLL